MSATCSSCGAAIVWTVTEKGARMPVDAKPEKRILLLEDVENRAPRSVIRDTYVSHFATCPNAAQHRKPRA